MNELLEQFFAEARDALEGIATKLMELESAPDDVELMTQLFRLVHTLKGNSGLFDFPEMTRVLHAGEDLMDAVRNQRVGYSQTLADRLLNAMDFVGMLCDEAESGQPPGAAVAHQALQLADSLRELLAQNSSAPDSGNAAELAAPAIPTQTPAPAPANQMPAPHLLGRVPEAQRMQAWQLAHTGQSLFWVHYRPDEECFFQGDDPLHQARICPGLLWGGIAERGAWPPLNELDAYRCQLDFHLMVGVAREELEAHFRYVPDQITVTEIPAMALVIPQGDTNGGAVYEDFVCDALAFLEKGFLASLRRAVDSMLELSNPALWLASALRWLQRMLEQRTPDVDAIKALVVSLRTLDLPIDPALALAQPHPTEAKAVNAAAQTQAATEPQPDPQTLASVLQTQRQILALPDDVPWLAGRLKGVVAVLESCLQAAGRSAQVPHLTQAGEAALQANSAAPLARWLDALLASPAHTQADAAAPSAANTAQKIPSAPTPLATDGGADNTMDGNALEGDASEGRFVRKADEPHSPKSLKVEQSKIDRLMNLIGEMVVAKNAIPYLANRAETHYGVRDLSREIKAQYAVINRISEEMQDAIMQVRMMPVSFVFQRFPRLVRDTSRRLGKEVHLVLEGQETAADKNIIESLGDPLVHMVRNSLDHGLELPETRKAQGKPEAGTLRISARQEADRVLIEISDDGKGIDSAVIKRKAYEKGLIDEATLERISDQEAIQLIFLPGFSTAETVSDLSGRGVGMDVVRTAIERVNGTVSLSSVLGQGTQIRLSLPLSMAVTNVMTIEAAGQIFGVPMDSVIETVRVPHTAVRSIKQGMVTVLRGKVLALRSLNQLLGLAMPPLTNDRDELAVLVVRVGDDVFGLLVDDFQETADIILKPMVGVLASLRAYAGSALMGDGSVLMVLNIKEMI
ncbi:two-component system chemotaxis sensor kinase CheA [Acidovorax sp. 62]|uniref:chemotaxis protein CheA n=1 Tax=Acidovorax sp. 62 TaxID=2035203 RepID=UPI000C1A09E3|nr:chemotaxis protein CheA [Acidovorax sp. 62]PIF89710.1 two-component system chemotaxis sensor kinase CheA [Acidovorax sp. 62]